MEKIIYASLVLAVLTPLISTVACTMFLLRGAQKIGDQDFAKDLVECSGVRNVRFYVMHVEKKNALAFACHLPFFNFIVLNRRSFLLSDPRAYAFTVAHELGHHALGHCKRDFWQVCTLHRMLYPPTVEQRMRNETDADAFAEKLCGISASDAARLTWV